MTRYILILLLPLLLTSCGLHGPNVVFEINVDKRDQSEVIKAPDNGPALTREEWQEILGYVREAAKLVKATLRDREIDAIIRIGKSSAVQEATRLADILVPTKPPLPKATFEEMVEATSEGLGSILTNDPVFE